MERSAVKSADDHNTTHGSVKKSDTLHGLRNPVEMQADLRFSPTCLLRRANGKNMDYAERRRNAPTPSSPIPNINRVTPPSGTLVPLVPNREM